MTGEVGPQLDRGECAKASQLLNRVADALDPRMVASVGAIRYGARLLAEVSLVAPSPSDQIPRCPTCGAAIETSRRGRPKTYCSTRCKDAARYSRKGDR